MKMHYRKLPPKIINYRDYKKLPNGNFLKSVKEVFQTKIQMEKIAEHISLLVHACKFSINRHLAKNSTYKASRDLL